jgi:Helix-turn-helix domain
MSGQTMDANRKTSEVELQRRALQRAMSIEQFCERYEIGRTTAYAEIRHGRLRARKCGKRTIISDGDADDWLQHLPVIGGSR